MLTQQGIMAQGFAAAKGLDRDGLKRLITAMAPPGQQSNLVNELASHSDSEVAAEIAQQGEQYAKMDGIRIVSRQDVSDDTAYLTYMIFYNNGTNDIWARSKLRRTANGWEPAAGP